MVIYNLDVDASSFKSNKIVKNRTKLCKIEECLCEEYLVKNMEEWKYGGMEV